MSSPCWPWIYPHDVSMSGGEPVAFLGIGAGVAGVSMFNAVSLGPAVASGVGSFLPVGFIAASPSSAPTLGFAATASWSRRALTWLVRVVLEVTGRSWWQ